MSDNYKPEVPLDIQGVKTSQKTAEEQQDQERRELKADREDEQNFRRNQIITNQEQIRINRRLVLITVLSSLITAFLGIWQGNMTRRALKIADDQVSAALDANRLARRAAEKAAEANERAYTQAQRSFDESIDALRIDQRAWLAVSVKPPGTTVTVNSAPSCTFVVSNSGKTAAIKVVANLFIEIVKNGDNPHFANANCFGSKCISIPPPLVAQTGVVFPNSPYEAPSWRIRFDARNRKEFDPLKQQEISALEHGSAWIALYGVVRYKDMFEGEHQTKFCSWGSVSPGQYSAQQCAAFNETN